jgi:serine kinase of HPr protein (carbohydrate metabolism regulator)
MSSATTRQLTFAGNSISVTYNHPRLAEIVHFLYRHVPADDQVPAHTRFYLSASDSQPEEFTLHRDETRLYQGSSLPLLADRLLGDSCYQLADRSRDGLLFHAAGLALAGQGVMLPGTMGAGKTTMSAWLLAQGFDYLTDELVYIAHNRDTMQVFPRPLNFKRRSRSVVKPFLNIEAIADQIISTGYVDLVPPTFLRPESHLSRPPLRLVVFPRYTPDAAFNLERLSPAQAGKALMECLINARNLPGHGFAEIIRLARNTPAYRMTYSSFEQVGTTVEDLLHQEQAA